MDSELDKDLFLLRNRLVIGCANNESFDYKKIRIPASRSSAAITPV